MASERDLELMTEVLAHWRRIERYLLSEQYPELYLEGSRSSDCGFCREYMLKTCCINCPIMKETGSILCSETPYRKAYKSLKEIYTCLEHGASPQDIKVKHLREKAIPAVASMVRWLEKFEEKILS